MFLSGLLRQLPGQAAEKAKVAEHVLKADGLKADGLTATNEETDELAAERGRQPRLRAEEAGIDHPARLCREGRQAHRRASA